ncbi:MAG: endonuclease V [Candidatus Thermoplasmatota archaeon]|jgi:deoxyribonuclease V|nr:endonuclease V [Candidatus Thermoplasmatota archaeon]
MAKLQSPFVDFDLYSDFYALVRQIPKGMVTTYGNLARALGDVVAARACGYMLSINPDPIGTPCYKVVKAGGEVGKFTHPLGTAEKSRRLQNDGIAIEDGRIVNFESICFDDFDSDNTLQKMREEQERMAPLISLEDDFSTSEIAAVDVSYDDDFGYGAMVINRAGNTEIRHKKMESRFPYIPGYLTYREFKFIRELAGEYSGLLLVDGNGFLHPRHIGLASFTGVMLGIPTIGVAKSLLLGRREGDWIYNGLERSAYMLRKNCVISAGHRISLDSAATFINEKYNGKYPEILKIAHNESVKLRLGQI